MNTTPEAVLSALAEPLAEFRAALDDGVSFADTQMRLGPPCSYTWAALARYWTGYKMEAASKDKPWLIRRLKNNGLEVTLNGWTFRPLKTHDDAPPAPGRNLARRAYYRQQFEQTRLVFDGNVPGFSSEQNANLILDWTVDAKRHPILALSKPQGYWKYQGVPNLEWRRYVEFPGDGKPAAFSPASDSDDDINVLPQSDEYGFGEEAE